MSDSRASGGSWRAGCSWHEWRVDFPTEAEAQKAARLHVREKISTEGVTCPVKVYPSTGWRRFWDWVMDQE